MPVDESDSPFEPSEAHLRRIRQRSEHLWEQDGRPAGQMEEYLERARELDAIETNRPAMQPNPLTVDPGQSPAVPSVEEAVLQENLGEFPALFTDQGDTMPTPETREIAKEFRDGER